ncbi:MAG: YfhO family protein, partial [Muribaculaceae bacterium]|nr:YfhO family protein [Muribaculaceae bacterium]
MKGWFNRKIAVAVTGLAVLIDLYTVDHRYVSTDSFVEVPAGTAEFAPDGIDALILQDTTHYRVLDIPGFSRPDRSYFHHMIGGYHAAKLNRYEDLLQRMLLHAVQVGYMPELRNDSVRASYPAELQQRLDNIVAAYRVLDMLNTRYIITGDQEAPVVYNTSALGSAWLVDSVAYVADADAEMAALASLDPGKMAVADARFATTLGNRFGSLAPGDTIMLDSYTPNKLTYTSVAKTPSLGVFSEIWFPWGWKATVDGNPVELGRVNYVLRALAIPAGRHEIVMTFDPDSLHVTGGVADASVTLIYLLLRGAMFAAWRGIVNGTAKGV